MRCHHQSAKTTAAAGAPGALEASRCGQAGATPSDRPIRLTGRSRNRLTGRSRKKKVVVVDRDDGGGGERRKLLPMGILSVSRSIKIPLEDLL